MTRFAAASAHAPEKGKNGGQQTDAGNYHVEVVARPKAQIFTRYAMAVAAGRGSKADALAYAKRFTDTPEVVAYMKAVEGTSVVSSPAWGGELVASSAV